MTTTDGPLTIGVAGLGTVGGGLLQLLANKQALGSRALRVVAVSARNRTRKRDVDISAFDWMDDPCELAARADLDVFVELIGGSDGPAKRAVEIALKRGAFVVTANKALLAEHGAALSALVEAHGGALLYEAAVAGGVPIIKVVRESLAGVDVEAVSGILNGTCNYLLSEMESSGRSYEDVLGDAQCLGYAEADPTMDVGGFDAGHKIALLAALAFGQAPDFAAVEIEGVDQVTLLDIRMAGKLGYRIKLVAKAERIGEGVRAHVHPVLLAFDHPLAGVNGPLNAVVVDGDPVGRLTFIGRGAGAGPTASAVASDLADIANGCMRAPFGKPLDQLARHAAATRKDEGRYFVRLLVKDRPGVIAAVAEDLANAGVSIESFLQDPAAGAQAVPIVLTTQRCARTALDAAIGEIAKLDFSAAPPRVIRIEETQGVLKPRR
jgi:homoserine dehydrogenase